MNVENHRITASYGTLLDQAGSTGSIYFHHAVEIIKKEIGVNKLDTEMLKAAVSLASVMERDYYTSTIGIAAQKISDTLSEISSSIHCLARE